jgi:CAAX prenyl protease-like protein
MATSTPVSRSAFFVWLDGLSDQRFTVTLYLLRWVIVLPLGWLLSPLATSADTFKVSSADPWSLLLPFLVVAPVLETLFECTVPYTLMHKLRGRQPQSPWPFVVMAALAMVVLHPLTPIVMTFAFITGAFLAYAYGHFASQSQLKAFLHTAVFHAGINIVGWTGILLQSRP